MPKGGPFCALLLCEMLTLRTNGQYMVHMHLGFCSESCALVILCTWIMTQRDFPNFSASSFHEVTKVLCSTN